MQWIQSQQLSHRLLHNTACNINRLNSAIVDRCSSANVVGGNGRKRNPQGRKFDPRSSRKCSHRARRPKRLSRAVRYVTTWARPIDVKVRLHWWFVRCTRRSVAKTARPDGLRAGVGFSFGTL